MLHLRWNSHKYVSTFYCLPFHIISFPIDREIEHVVYKNISLEQLLHLNFFLPLLLFIDRNEELADDKCIRTMDL